MEGQHSPSLPYPMIKTKAYAKINLSLEVTGRRIDGYHEICTLIHSIDLSDSITFSLGENILVTSNEPTLNEENNLVFRSANLLKNFSQYPGGTSIKLNKNIPIAAGLGGGSSDAAVTLIELNELWNLRISAQNLSSLATQLGTDVPFFLTGGCALAVGRGDTLNPTVAIEGIWAIILSPPHKFSAKTSEIYSLLNKRDFTDGSHTRELATEITNGNATIYNLSKGQNVFEKVAMEAFSGLDHHFRTFLKCGAPFVKLSGTGPSLFTLVDDWDLASHLYKTVKQEDANVHLAELIHG